MNDSFPRGSLITCPDGYTVTESKLARALKAGCDFDMQTLIRNCMHPSLTRGKVFTRNANRTRLFMSQHVFTSTPLVSLRKTAWKTALREMEWFLSGSTRLEDAHPSVRKWWEVYSSKYMDGNSYVVFNYGQQFRASEGIMESEFDQLKYLLDGIREHPFSTRNVITLWNTADMANPECPITNCHGTVIQAFVDDKMRLSLSMYQRSADLICGVPHNWIQYWAFLLYLAHHTGFAVGNLHWVGGDTHIYECHEEIAGRMANLPLDSIKTPQMVYTPNPVEWKNGQVPPFWADDFYLDGEYAPLLTDSVEMVE